MHFFETLCFPILYHSWMVEHFCEPKITCFNYFCNVNSRRVHCTWLKIAHFVFQLEISPILTLDFQTKLQILCIRFYLMVVSEKTKQIKDDWACFGWMTMKIALLRWPLLFWFFSQKFWKELPTANDIMQMQLQTLSFLYTKLYWWTKSIEDQNL
jgi:hypothetical protein